MTDHEILILGSNSPRRRTMLAWAGWAFAVDPADVDECVHPNEDPVHYVQRLALTKARAIAKKNNPNRIVIAADTTVVDQAQILGKPDTPQKAVEMLKQLRGKTHQVFTALAVLQGQHLETELCITDVPMRDYSDDEIQVYVASGDPMDKAGAYAIQHPDFNPVHDLTGCFAGVMGMPMCHLVRSLRKYDLAPVRDVPQVCQSTLSYHCPVSQDILNGRQV